MCNNFNTFEEGLTRYINADFLRYIQSKKIGVIGTGGLGSNILNALVRTGFNNFVIADNDKVDISNLNRQLYTMEDIGEYKAIAITNYLKKINKDLNIKTITETVNKNNIKNIFAKCDIVFEAVDIAETKKNIYTSLYKENIILIFGSGLAGIDIINNNSTEIKKIKENIYIVGDGTSEVNANTHPYAPKVIAVASVMAGVVLDLLDKQFKNTGVHKK